MCNDTGRIIVGKNINYIIGILNSKLFFYSVKHFYGGGVLGEHGIRMKHTFFEKFPCINYDRNIEYLAEKLSKEFDDLLANQLDNIIYESYGLTCDEVNFIEADS